MDDCEPTRLSLLARLRDRGDHGAWGEFVEVYTPFVYGVLRKRGLQDADAADLTQETMRSVFQAVGQFDHAQHAGAFRGWLVKVVQSRLNDFHARKRRQAVGSGDTAAFERLEAVPAPDHDAGAIEKEYRKCLFQWATGQVRGEFQENTWRAFWMTYVDGQGSKEATEVLGMSVEAVYMARSRVLARLRKKIQQVEGQADGRIQ